MMKENQEEWAGALEKDLGHKSELFVQAIETSIIVDDAEDALKNLDEWMRPHKVGTPLVMQPGSSFIKPEPYGVVLIISPWNYPISLVMVPLVGAIAAGNCAVIKPSEVSATTSSLIAKLIPKYLDKEAFAVVEGAVEETTALLKEKFDYILYTGNGTVGKIVMKAASENLTPVTLELGGKSPCIVDKSADLEVTAKRILWGKFLNVGQTCIAPDYVLVEKSIEQDLLARLKKNLSNFYGENPQQSADYSRIINQRHVNRLATVLERAKKEGAEVVTGGTVDLKDNYLAPTIVRNVLPNSPLMEDELFGPLLPVVTVNNFDEAIAFVNSREKPLAAYLFSNSKQNQQSFLDNTSFGGGCINDVVMHCGNLELPFGGVGGSGMGGYHGSHSFHLFSHHKGIVQKSFLLDNDIRYPPYTPTKLSRLSFIRSLKLSHLLYGVGAITVAGVAIFLGLTDFGRTQIQATKSLLVFGLKTALKLLE
jgi:acyl-CoA reductase-like NAD-dependent aldehyde dehydrogenase